MMNVFFVQTILAAPEDADKWINILFVVVLAVFWIIRGVVKEKTKDSYSKSIDQQQPTRKPIHSSTDRIKSLWEQFLEQTRQPADSASRKTNRPNVPQSKSKTSASMPDIHKVVPDSEQSTILRTHEHSVKPNLSISTSSILPNKPEFPEDEYISELLLDYADPEKLRRAILHYEILGKPLSLRNLSDNF